MHGELTRGGGVRGSDGELDERGPSGLNHVSHQALGGRRLAVPGGDFQDVEIRRFLIHPLRNRWAERGTDETGGSAMVVPPETAFQDCLLRPVEVAWIYSHVSLRAIGRSISAPLFDCR